MSARKEMMKEMASLPVVGLIKLLKAHSSEPDAIICVFEGEDAKYYGARVDTFFQGRNRRNVPCKGKGNLLSLRKSVENNSNLKDVHILYFADRDFDFEHTTTDNIYFTPCYSVENLYVNEETFIKILNDEYGLCPVTHEEHYNQILGLFRIAYGHLEKSLLDLNSWIMCQIKRSDIDDQIQLNLNNTKVSDFVDIDISAVAQKYDLELLSDIFPKSVKIDDSDLDTARELLISYKEGTSFRGKYMLQFMRIFIERLNAELLDKQSSVISLNVKPKLFINDGNALSVLSQYAKTPVCLTNFLARNSKLALAS